MADPVVHITGGIPDSGTGNITTLGQTLLDGANITYGATTDAAVAAGAAGSVSAKLRSMSRDIVGGIVLQAGANIIGAVTQSGAWNVTNITGTISLPTGAATSAKQPALGTAGTPASDVITVQGAASMTPLLSRISDGVNAAAIKAASTAPAATDPAIVVSLSPNSVALGAGAANSTTQRVTIDNTQLAALATTPQARSAGFQLVDLPTERQGSAGGLKIDDIFSQYETVAASQTDQAMGATGATGDYLAGVLVIPGTSAAGVVQIKDGSGSAITIFAGGGTTALADLKPFMVPLGLYSTSGAWKVTTNTNVTAIGIGKFT
jgi:hypothetical protein